MSFSREILDLKQLARACYLAGKDATAEEIAVDIGASDEAAVRQSLGLCGIRLSPKPFGFRIVEVSLSPAQVEGLRAEARSQGLPGIEAHQRLLEQASRRLAADPNLLHAVLDPSLKPIFIEETDYEVIKHEAARRETTPENLGKSLLHHIARDTMFAAIIDDQE